jgi:hypothetical protein
MIKTLRTEKDYYSRQLENLRKELETVKMSMPPSQNVSSQSITIFDAPRETMNQSFGEARRQHNVSVSFQQQHNSNNSSFAVHSKT